MIDDKIKLLGGKFRGLWQIKELKVKRATRLSRCLRKSCYDIKWYVTFVHNGDYIETTSHDTMEEALDAAINFLGV